MKCKICNQEIKSKTLFEGDYDQINISVLWPGVNIDLDGHRVCLENIDKYIIKPNRADVCAVLKEKILFVEKKTIDWLEEKNNQA